MNRFLTLLLTLLLSSWASQGAETLPAGTKVTKLALNTGKVVLDSPFAYAQLLVSATLDQGETVDVTRLVAWTVPQQLAKVSGTGQVRPLADGEGELRATLGDKSVSVPLVVSRFKTETAIRFTTDVQPVLSKLGCNAGTCHGSAQGKNGFKLSLRGYDPLYDHRALTDDIEGRRFNRAAPERSLMMLKPAGAVPHAGGVVWTEGEPYFELVRRWIAQGVKLDLTAPKVKAISISPNVVSIEKIGSKQQFCVTATYTDGTQRDVTAEAFIESSNNEVATLDKAGLLTTVRRGEATMLARYEGSYAAAGLVVMGERAGYVWKPQPVYSPLDELVDAKLKKMKINASGLCTDEEFLRRVSIDLTGLPPTAHDVREFLADARASRIKREAKIDALIGSEAYIEHWTNKWSDLLQVNRKFLGDAGATALRKWIRESIAANKPYDQFASEVLTASGSNIETPAASYFKVLREADAVMENTTQLFLAIRFNCNKCHDHPFEKWTQDQYYETAAFFSQVNRKEDPKYAGQRIGGTAVEGAKPLVEIIADAKTGDMKHERTSAVVAPKFPFTHPGAKDEPTVSRRTRFSHWLTAKDNPYFAKSYVNRIWSYLTGVGIIEPVDDIRAGNPPTNPELLDRLTNDFIASGFNTRALIQGICKTRTYQLSLTSNPFNADDDSNYSHAQPRRLPAEVLFDAIHRAAGTPTQLPGVAPGTRAAQLLDSNIDLPGGFLELFGKPVRESACECERSNTMMLGPVLAMVNGPIVGDAIRDPNSEIVRYTEQEKDNAKVVEQIYLSVLNRKPTPEEVAIGAKAILAGAADHAALFAEYDKHKTAFETYAQTIPGKLKPFEDTLRAQKPSAWTTLTPASVVSRAGSNVTDATKTGSIVKVFSDATVLVTGKDEQVDIYTVTLEIKQDAPLTGLRLECLLDDVFPAKGPGRSNGNFVLNEFKVKAQGYKEEKARSLKLINPLATFSQGSFDVANAIDGNPGTGWGIAPQMGQAHVASFQFEKPLDAKAGLTLTVVMEQRYGTGHTIGKFRLSQTTDATVRFGSSVPPDVLAVLDLPTEKRSAEHQARIRDVYIAQDAEYTRLQREIPVAPPKDPRGIGAQDLVWALMNTPAFLFNR